MTGQSPSAERFQDAKNEIDRCFPAGQFVAMELGQIVAEAASHRQLVENILPLGKTPKDMLIVQAGAAYPDSAIIF